MLDAYLFVLSVARTEIKGDEREALESTGCCHKFHWAQRHDGIRVQANTGFRDRAEVKGTECPTTRALAMS